MKIKHKRMKNKDFRIIFYGMSVLLITLITFYYAVTFISTDRMTEQVEMIANHPFPVVIAAGEVDTALGELRGLADRLATVRADEVAARGVEKKYAEIYKNLEEPMKTITNQYISNPDDVTALNQIYLQLVGKQEVLLSLAYDPSKTMEDIRTYEEEYIYGLFEQMQECIDKIIESSKKDFNHFEQIVQDSKTVSIYSFTALTMAILAALFIYQYILRRQSEEIGYQNQLFQLLSKNVDNVFVIYDINSEKSDFVSENASRVLGLTPEEIQRDGAVMERYVTAEDRVKLDKLRKENAYKDSWEITFSYQNPKTGELREITMKTYFIKLHERVHQMIQVFTDETESVLMQQRLEAALEAARSANTAKSQFLSNMSHDIRTPMNVIIGMTAIASANMDTPEKLKDALAKITASSKHLLSLINDILDMSKIESGKIALRNDEFSLADFIHNFVTIVQPQMKAKQIDLDISIKNVKHEAVIGDTLRINQVLLNLVGNAVKFTAPQGKIWIEICELKQKYSQYGTYQFIIGDTGVGMPQEFLDRIFEPFERAKNSTMSRVEGTGLGMTIVKNIIDMMNGDIKVESEIGKGTVFTIKLHLKLQDKQDEEYLLEQAQDLRVLVVDDDPEISENVAQILEEIGMTSEWVVSGTEAVERTVQAHEQHNDYHTVLLDWIMPDMNGLEVTRKIRETVGDDTPIIVITAYDWTEIEEEAKKAGVTAFMPKPIFKSKLYQVMKMLSEEGNISEAVTEYQDVVSYEGKHILLVEDNELNMEIAREIISATGVEIDEAKDGEEAVQMIQNSPIGYYDLVFMDVQMPNMDGYEATGRIRAMNRPDTAKLPIIAMTANAFLEDVNKALESGMNRHIAKPIEISELYRVMEEWMRNE